MLLGMSFMIRVLCLLVTLLPLSVFATDCMDAAKTQLELNQCAAKSAKHAQEQLEELYRTLEKKYASHQSLVDQLKKNQQQWLAYRDSQVALKYPDGPVGSIYPMCVGLYLEELTKAQIASLKKMFYERQEGDACGADA